MLRPIQIRQELQVISTKYHDWTTSFTDDFHSVLVFYYILEVFQNLVLTVFESFNSR
jgi:hypothetical protein